MNTIITVLMLCLTSLFSNGQVSYTFRNSDGDTITRSIDCDIAKDSDKFTNQVKFYSPLENQISFIKYPKKGAKPEYYISLRACGLTPTPMSKGVIILFEDGDKISKPDVDIDEDVSDNVDVCSYDVTAFFKLTGSDILKLKTKQIKAFRLYIHDAEFDNGWENFQGYFNCLLLAK